jgi:hypothetical protein
MPLESPIARDGDMTKYDLYDIDGDVEDDGVEDDGVVSSEQALLDDQQYDI